MRKIFYFIIISITVFIIYITMPILSNLFAGERIHWKHNRSILIIGHRGGADLAPENSLLCIEKGINTGADMIEIDIHLTKDSNLVVCHDQTIDRTTNGEGRIAEMTLDEIKHFNIIDHEGNETNEKIPTLDEVLKLVNKRCRLLIEIKKTKDIYKGIEKKLLATIEKHNAWDWIVVQSFNDHVLETINSLNDSVRLEKLIVLKLPFIPVIFDGGFTKFSMEKYHYISSFNFYHKAITPQIINKIHSSDKEVKIWTLGAPKEEKILPVDGIITDRPDLWISL